MAQPADALTEGYKALFKTFPDYKMIVYPTRRSASYPQWYYDATEKNATEVSLTDNGYGFCCAAKGDPFQIPKNATEVMWNHIMRYNTRYFRSFVASAETAAHVSFFLQRPYVQLGFMFKNPLSTPYMPNSLQLFP